jgi:hypothetical protein
MSEVKFESLHVSFSGLEEWTQAAEHLTSVMGEFFPSLSDVTPRSIGEVRRWILNQNMDISDGYWLPSLTGDVEYASHDGEWMADVEVEANLVYEYDEDSGPEVYGWNAVTLVAYSGGRSIRFCHDIEEDGTSSFHVLVDYRGRPSTNHLNRWLVEAGKYAGKAKVTTVTVDEDGNVVDRYEQVVGRE